MGNLMQQCYEDPINTQACEKGSSLNNEERDTRVSEMAWYKSYRTF